MNVERITIIGGGTMGNGIAHVCAQAGRTVTLVDTDQDLLEKALGTIFKNMDRQVKKEIISAGEKEEAAGPDLHGHFAGGRGGGCPAGGGGGSGEAGAERENLHRTWMTESPGRRHPGHQYFLHLHHGDRRLHEAP